MNRFMKIIVGIMMVLYFVSPVDLLPGMIDDIILIWLVASSSSHKRIEN